MNRSLLDYSPEIEAFASPEAAVDRHAKHTSGSEMQRAAELLEHAEAGELEGYLVGLIDRAAGSRARPETRALASVLARTAQRLFQHTDSSSMASAGRIFDLELEGLSAEDQAFEVARRFVRLATAAAQRVAPADAALSPHAVARRAAASAARTYAPGLLIPVNPSPATPDPRLTHEPVFLSTHHKEPVMHDIDRTQLEYSAEQPGFETEQFEFGESEWSPESGAVLSEADEYELASELLGVASEEELDQFLGSLIKKVAKGAGKLIRSPIGQAVGGVLKGVAKKALPLAGGALGGYVGGPLGAKIGSGLASAAGSALGLEGEALAQEDQEFEGAKQFVRLAADTVSKAAAASPSADPRAVAQSAALNAARQLAPGLLKKMGGAPGAPGAAGRGQSGRWVRQGQRIVIYGA